MVHVDVEVELVDLNEVDLFVDSYDVPQYHVELVLLVRPYAQANQSAHVSLPVQIDRNVRCARDGWRFRWQALGLRLGLEPEPNGYELEPVMQDRELE